MKKQTALVLILLLTFATPAFAANHDNHGHDKDNEHNSPKTQALQVSVDPCVSVSPSVSVEPSVSVSPSAIPCDPNGEWKNHGQFVSCVAKLHLGGKFVSEAAQSDIGKKHHDNDGDDDH